ncbi:aspartate-semialdehyde dehydrogenase [Candidatus Rickettsiella viridis]|uniref:Aspartate-semialdehyde dehydrogenase n=1 Tax=Candidatus Rickettsiella viridis TaxID=676208 RepID=A0A2Z5UWS6_9COXI|nr:aspartate-semialdehyde dehydrogenase [Candidatus Rickettsiella viridis]BBB15545.1 aspartate-semialdehyde dehydrogenase [Candidatus Rickettsiella viridis]
MTKKFNVAVIGATGLVGETMLSLLAQRHFPIDQFYAVASQRSAGETISFNKKSLFIEDLAKFDFKKVDIALFSAGATVSKEYVPIATKNGCIAIDNTSQFRYDDDVPLVIPEVNPQALKDYKKRNIIANPNCSTIQMLVALKPIYDAVGISRINVATYQSVSGAGRKAFTELLDQCGRLLNGMAIKKPQAFANQIAFNVIPHIDKFQDNGYTREEMKMVWETQKIFADKDIQVNPTAVRVPVLHCHSEAVHIETKKKISVAKVKELLKKASGIELIDRQAENGYPMPIMKDSEKYKDAVMVGRIREDISLPLGLNLWIVSDNIRKGAALNAIQIAECLVQEHL